MEMIMAVAITRQDVSVGDLRHEAGRTRDAKAARRMLAIACVMEGQSREDAAECCGVEPSCANGHASETETFARISLGSPDMDRQTLRDWVHRFNADGLAGLADLPRCCGPKPRLSPEQEARSGVYVGTYSKRVREMIWDQVRVYIEDGNAVLAWAAPNDAGFEFDTCGRHWRVPVDFDRFRLVEVHPEAEAAPPLAVPRGRGVR